MWVYCITYGLLLHVVILVSSFTHLFSTAPTSTITSLANLFVVFDDAGQQTKKLILSTCAFYGSLC